MKIENGQKCTFELNMELGKISIGKYGSDLTEIMRNPDLENGKWYITATLGIMGDKIQLERMPA